MRVTILPKAEATEHEKAVGIWIRVSTEDQARSDSPEHHEQRARMYAASRGWHVVRVYNLSAVSGKTVMEHPETKAMLEDVAARRISGLIFSKLARLARNTKELLEFSEYFREHNADLISLAESVDTSTPAGRLFYSIIASMAQWEREEIADRVKASVVVRAKLGKSTGGAAPLGYKWQDNRLVVNEAEAPVRRLIYELFMEHKRLRTVARLLNEAGHRSRKGRKFTDATVRRLIEAPDAKGMRRANYAKSRGSGKGWDPKPRSEWVFSECEPVVSPELWDACNSILEARLSGYQKPPTKKVAFLFTGLLYCECGAKMAARADWPTYRCKKCKNKVGVTHLEEVFRGHLRDFFLSDQDVRDYLDQGDTAVGEKRALLEALRAEEARVRSNMDQTYQLYLSSAISAAGFKERYGPMEERLGQLAGEIPRLQGEADFLVIQNISGEDIVAQARDVYGRWETLSFEEKRAIVETTVERVTVGRDSVTIDLGYAPVPGEIAEEK